MMKPKRRRCKGGVELIAAERERQKTQEQWTDRHDDFCHGNGGLALAAECYLTNQGEDPSKAKSRPSKRWPWTRKDWKPKDRLRNLVRAGALIAAEIDRLQRAGVG